MVSAEARAALDKAAAEDLIACTEIASAGSRLET